jgi:cell division ATPase FtsA
MVVERDGAGVTILGTASQAHPVRIAVDGIHGDVEALMAACDNALTRAEDATEAVAGRKVVPDSVLMAVPTGSLRGAVGTGSVQRPHLEQGIVEAECFEPALRAGRHAMRLLGKETDNGAWELLDASVVSFAIDGHRVTDPIGFRGHKFESATFVTAARRRTIALLRDVADHLQLNPPWLIAEPMALAAAVPHDGLIIQAGARTTGLILVRHSAPALLAGLDVGGEVFTRALMDVFDLTPYRADRVLRAYAERRLDEKARLAVRQALTAPLEEWSRAVVERLYAWRGRDVEWSPQVLLCGGLAYLDDLQQAVAGMRWVEMLPFPRTPRVRTWGGANLSLVDDRTGSPWRLTHVTALCTAVWGGRDRSSDSLEGRLGTALGARSPP